MNFIYIQVTCSKSCLIFQIIWSALGMGGWRKQWQCIINSGEKLGESTCRTPVRLVQRPVLYMAGRCSTSQCLLSSPHSTGRQQDSDSGGLVLSRTLTEILAHPGFLPTRHQNTDLEELQLKTFGQIQLCYTSKPSVIQNLTSKIPF